MTYKNIFGRTIVLGGVIKVENGESFNDSSIPKAQKERVGVKIERALALGMIEKATQTKKPKEAGE